MTNWLGRRGPSLSGGVVAVVVMFAAACTTSVTLTLDDESAEQAIRSELLPQLEIDFSEVECPPDQPLVVGSTFTCTATKASGGEVEIEVTIVDAEGNIDLELRTLIAERVEAVLLEQLPDLASVDCGEDRPFEVDDTFECSGTDDAGDDLTIAVSQTDDQGNIAWEVVD